MDNESFSTVISELKLNIGCDRYPVFYGTDVLQYFKRQGYNHKASECKTEDPCYKCHENQKSKECNKEIVQKTAPIV